MRAGVIYIATNTYTRDQYVGLTIKTADERRKEHFKNARRGVRTHFYAAIRKYGEDAFVFEEHISVLERSELSSLERQTIKELQAKYNQTNGGEVTFGRKYDDATKERIRQSNTGKKRTAEQKEAHRRISKERWDTNPEFRVVALAAAVKGRANIDREKQRRAAGEASRDRVWSDESRAKLSASCMGRVYGPEVTAKMAAAKRKPVKCNETGEIFSCREEAAKRTEVSCRTIFRDVQGENRKPAKGRLTFSYI